MSYRNRKELSVIQFFSLGNCWFDLSWEIEEEEQIGQGKWNSLIFYSVMVHIPLRCLGGHV